MLAEANHRERAAGRQVRPDVGRPGAPAKGETVQSALSQPRQREGEAVTREGPCTWLWVWEDHSQSR